PLSPEGLSASGEPVPPPVCEPARRGLEEPVADLRAGDARVREAAAVAAEGGPPIAPLEEALDPGQDRGIGGIRPEEAEHFVQTQHLAGGPEARLCQRVGE